MTVIRETLILEDKFTSIMTQCLQVAQRIANTLDNMRASTMNVETTAAAAAVQIQELAGRVTQTNGRGTFLFDTIRSLADAFLGIQSVRWLVNTPDQLTSINARLRLITGSAEITAAAWEEIHRAVMRNRGAYADMAGFISQLGTVAGNAFIGTDELVVLAEQIQEQMAISGTFGASAQAMPMQLTQGLASGTLRGEEFNSMLEQTLMIAQTTAEYMGVTTGKMRELAGEGKVTAEVVKNAMLGATEETNVRFEQMSIIQAQVWTMFQNVAIQALDPVLDVISWLVDSIDPVGPIILGLGTASGVFLLAANWTSIRTAAITALTTVQEIPGVIMATTWGLPPIVIALVIGVIYAVTAAVDHLAGTSALVTGIIAGAVLAVAVIIGDTVIGSLNGITQAAQSIFVTPFLGIVEWVLNITNGGSDSFGGAVADLIGNIISWFLDLGKVVMKIIDAILRTNWTAGLASL